MDLKNKNTALNFVFSFLIIVLAFMFPLAMLIEQLRTTYAGVLQGSVSSIDIFKNYISFFENLGKGDVDFVSLYSSLVFIGMFLGIGITAFVHSVIVTVKTINGLVHPVDSRDIIKHLASFAVAILIYVSMLIALYYRRAGDYKLTIGAGPIMLLVIASIALVICAILHVSAKNERKTLNKVFDVTVAGLAVCGMFFVFSGPIIVDGAYKYGLIGLFIQALAALSNGGGGGSGALELMMAVEFSVLGSVMLVVGGSSASNLITNGFGFQSRQTRVGPAWVPYAKDDKKLDYAKSSVVKSSLFLGFLTLGTTIVVLCYQRLYSPLPVTLSITGILSFIVAASCLGLSIANKVVQDKNQPKEEAPAEAPKEEKKEEAKAE